MRFFILSSPRYRIVRIFISLEIFSTDFPYDARRTSRGQKRRCPGPPRNHFQESDKRLHPHSPQVRQWVVPLPSLRGQRQEDLRTAKRSSHGPYRVKVSLHAGSQTETID